VKYLLFLTFPLLVLDQATKLLVLRHIGFGTEVPVIPGFFSLVHVTNTGAAFGVMQGNNAFFIVLALVALAVVFGLLWRDRPAANRPRPRLTGMTKIALALLASGIVGNLIDRLWHGQVTDFLHFYYRQYEYPSFNLADSCICIAAALLIFGSMSSGKDKKASRPGAAGAAPGRIDGPTTPRDH
jgi:signal peptidase II